MIDSTDYKNKVRPMLDYDCLDRYEQLLKEFQAYRSSIGTIKNHSAKYLLSVAVDIEQRLKLLSQMRDDEYKSVAATRVHWEGLLEQVMKQLRKKL